MTKQRDISSELEERIGRLTECKKALGNEFQLSKRSGVSQKTINNFGLGTDSRCSVVKAIAKAAKVPAGWLAFGEGTSKPPESTILLEAEKYESILPLAASEEARVDRIPWALFRKDDFGKVLPWAGHWALRAFRVKESNLGPRFNQGDWLLVDREQRFGNEAGDFCVNVGGKILVREVVFHDNGDVSMNQPGHGSIPTTVRRYTVKEFQESVLLLGKVVAVVKMVLPHDLPRSDGKRNS